MVVESLIKKIKEKKELSGLPDELIKSILEEYLSKNKISLNSDKNQKLVVKDIRSKLRVYTGQYTPKHGTKKREKLLSKRDFESILNEHVSTRERISDYPLVKQIINKINPKVILDLGCGLNPIAIATKGVKYHAYDINHNDLDLVKGFFIIQCIDGDIHHKDIRQESIFPSSDICIIFKVLDILGEDKAKITKKLLTIIDSRIFLISFATHTLSGRPMNSPYRRWFESILKNLNYKYEVKRTQSELFYIIEKQTQ